MSFCATCGKLSILYNSSKKKCLKCKNDINNNISVICEDCSKSEKICSCCLKKNNQTQNTIQSFRCSACGKK